MATLKVNPQKMVGSWSDGYTLDRHVESSEFLGYDGSGRGMFETKRTEIGEAVYQLKYGSRDEGEATKLAAAAATFVKNWTAEIDAVVPMPASKTRTVQPVGLVAQLLAKALGIKVVDAVSKVKDTPELKNVSIEERQKLLEGAYEVDAAVTKGRDLLLLDDLFQSGATMNAVAAILQSKGGAAKVFALALTRTKR